jgi:hypothetical protein
MSERTHPPHNIKITRGAKRRAAGAMSCHSRAVTVLNLGEATDRQRSIQTCPERGQSRQPSLQLVGSGGVTGPDASLEFIQTLVLTLGDQLAFVLWQSAHPSQESLSGIGRPLQTEGARDGRIRASLLPQRQGFGIDITPRGARASVPLVSSLRVAWTIPPTGPRQGAPT